MSVITFVNHSPIRIADADAIETVWEAGQDFGHHRIRCYTTKRGKKLYWSSYNSGRHYGANSPATMRTYLSTPQAIKDYLCGHYDDEYGEFPTHRGEAIYHADVEHLVDPSAILDVDAVA